MADAPRDKQIEAALLGVAQQVEKSLDGEIDALLSLQEDDFDCIRRRRMTEMKIRAENEALWRRRGHGKLCNIAEKDFFKHGKETQRMVVLVTRPGTSRYAKDMEEHLALVAESHFETFFAVINADKAPFLCEKFGLQVMPSLILVKDSEVSRVLHGLDSLVPNGKFSTVVIESHLHELALVTHTDIGDDE
jgi:thioredoxin-like negative regulator of GroEL